MFVYLNYFIILSLIPGQEENTRGSLHLPPNPRLPKLTSSEMRTLSGASMYNPNLSEVCIGYYLWHLLGYS